MLVFKKFINKIHLLFYHIPKQSNIAGKMLIESSNYFNYDQAKRFLLQYVMLYSTQKPLMPKRFDQLCCLQACKVFVLNSARSNLLGIKLHSFSD